MTLSRMPFKYLVQTLSLLGLAALGNSQFQAPFAYKSYDDTLFTPLEDLSLLSASEYTFLGHPLFPDYSVRIKKSHFCDGTVRCDVRL